MPQDNQDLSNDPEFIPRISGDTILRGCFDEKVLSYRKNFVPVKWRASFKVMMIFQRRVMDAVDAGLINIAHPGKTFSSHTFERESFIVWFIASGTYNWIRSFRWRHDDTHGIYDPLENQQDFIAIHRKLDLIIEQNDLIKVDITQISEQATLIDPIFRHTEELLSLFKKFVSDNSPSQEGPGPKDSISKKDYPDFKMEVHRLFSDGVPLKMIPYRATITKFFAPGVKNDGKKRSHPDYFHNFNRHYNTIFNKWVKRAIADKSEQI